MVGLGVKGLNYPDKCKDHIVYVFKINWKVIPTISEIFKSPSKLFMYPIFNVLACPDVLVLGSSMLCPLPRAL